MSGAAADPIDNAGTAAGMSRRRRVLALRIAIVVAVLAIWQLVSVSGLLFRDVVPSLTAIAAALIRLLSNADFYRNLDITGFEIGVAVAIGGVSGLAAGIALGANRFLSDAFEAFLHYLGPTPKIIFFPVMIMWFGVGEGSKIAMGAISCFFPIAISAAAGMRQIDRVLIRVGRSFRASTWQMVTKIYLHAMREPIINGFRLGIGVAIIGTLLAETKLSKQGLGYLVIQAYALFDMPKMYALVIVLFVLAIGLNVMLGKLRKSGPGSNFS
jgi:ABC-type nitrate/sulfonate/bicarbonate transport system permease component